MFLKRKSPKKKKKRRQSKPLPKLMIGAMTGATAGATPLPKLLRSIRATSTTTSLI